MTKPRRLSPALRGHLSGHPIRKTRKPGMTGGQTAPWLSDADMSKQAFDLCRAYRGAVA